jgi:lysophospholipase L1-like esterase
MRRKKWRMFRPCFSLVFPVCGLAGFARADSPAAIKVWTLGDSITWGYTYPGGYQTELYVDLTAAGYSVNYLGTKDDDGSALLDSVGQNWQSGFNGATTSFLRNNLTGLDTSDIYASPAGGYWLTTNNIGNPDYILLDAGACDLEDGVSPASALASLGLLLDKLTALRPEAKIIVSNLIPSTYTATLQNLTANEYNPYVPGLIAAKAASGESVSFVDQFDNVSTNQLIADRLHPTPAGYNDMGDEWALAVEIDGDLQTGSFTAADTPANQATILANLATGCNGGAWNGPGISSSAAAANHRYGIAFADGAEGLVWGLSSGQLKISYALYGDMHQDGVVDGSDFAILSANFGKHVTGGWEQGDFNYDGSVNGVDFVLLAENFGKTMRGTSVTLPQNEWTALESFAATHGLLSDVPEPSSVAILFTLGFFGPRHRVR